MAEAIKKTTLAEFRPISEQAAHEGKLLELIDGEIMEKEVGSFTPSKIAGKVLTYINIYLFANEIGYVTGADGTYEMDADNAFIPDVGYISKGRLPQQPERAASVPPDLAVEVKSPTDSKRELRRKAERYLSLGTRLVWLIFPEEQVIEVYAGDQDVQTFGPGQRIDGADVLPGFSLDVDAVFS